MKRFLSFFATGMLAATTLNAQNGAHIQMKTTTTRTGGPNQKTSTSLNDIYATAEGTRMEIASRMESKDTTIKTVMLQLKSKPHVIISLDDRTKTYTETTLSDSASSDTSKYTIKIIGNETVGGYACKHITVTDSWGSADEWLTTSIDYSQYADFFRNDRSMRSSAKEKALKDAGVIGFPVKISRKTRYGSSVMELVSFGKQNVDASLLKIPDGYTKREIPTYNTGGKDYRNMTPEERKKLMEEMMKKMQEQKSGGGN